MRHQILVDRNGVTVTYGANLIVDNTFHYLGTTNDFVDLRMGAIATQTIEVELWKSSDQVTYPDLVAGDAVQFQTLDADGNVYRTYPYMTVDLVEDIRDHYSIVCFDCTKKLNISFAQTLLSLKSSFPMTVSSLLTELLNASGLTWTNEGLTTATILSVKVNYFFSQSITVANLIKAIAELIPAFVVASASTVDGIYFANYNRDSTDGSRFEYLLAPTDTTVISPADFVGNKLGQIYYKQNGLTIQDTELQHLEGVVLEKSNGVLLSAAYSPPYTPNNDNLYYINQNILLDNFYSGDLTTVAQELGLAIAPDTTSIMYNRYDYPEYVPNPNPPPDNIPSGRVLVYRPATAHLFPFNCPWYLGDYVQCVDVNGTYIRFPIMRMEVTDSEVIISATGNPLYSKDTSVYLSNEDSEANTSSLLNKAYPGIATVWGGTANLNNYTAPGIYYFPYSTTYVNFPNSAGNGFLMVFADDSGSYIKQIFYRVGSNPNTHKDMFERLFGSGAWGSWSEIARYSNPSITLNTVSGYTFSNFECRKKNGWVRVQVQVSTTSSPGNGGVTVCTMPSGYRPDFEVRGRSPGASGGHYYNWSINSSGTFAISRNPASVSANTRISVAYPVAD